jgi:hypothetical protein
LWPPSGVRAVERRLGVGGRMPLPVDRDTGPDRRGGVARDAHMADRRCAGGEIDHDRIGAGDRKREGERIGPEQRIDAAGRVHPHRMRVGEGHADQPGAGDALHVIAEAEDVAAADERDRGDARLARLADGEIGGVHAGDVAGAAIAVEARGRRRLVGDADVRPPVEVAGPQLADGRVDVIGSLNVMAVQVGVDHAVGILRGVVVVAAGGTEDAHQEIPQHVGRNGDRLRAAHRGALSPSCQLMPAMARAITRTHSAKSSMRIASSGLWLPF